MKKADQILQKKAGEKENTGTRTKRQASVRGLRGALMPAVLICTLAALALSGCKSGSSGSPDPEKGSGTDVTLTLEAEGTENSGGGNNAEENQSQDGSKNTDGNQAQDGSKTPEGIGSQDGSTASAETPQSEAVPDYIFPDSDKDLLAWEDVKDLTADQLRLARNEIYARHGRGFTSQDLQEYFDARPWYKRTVEPEAFSESLLNEYEKRNIRYLKGLEPVEELSDLGTAPSKEVIDRYGYENGHSLLSFQLKPGTVKDCGEYYQADAVYYQGIEAPGNLSPGERVTLVFNELTGETKTLEYREGGLYPVDEGPYPPQYYYRPSDDGSPVVLYQDSDDRVDKPVYEGQLYIRKDATMEIDIVNQSDPVTLEKLNEEYNWYNGVYFDRKGYVTRLVFYGD